MGQKDPIPGSEDSLPSRAGKVGCWCGTEAAKGFGKNEVAWEEARSQARWGGLDWLPLSLLPSLNV